MESKQVYLKGVQFPKQAMQKHVYVHQCEAVQGNSFCAPITFPTNTSTMEIQERRRNWLCHFVSLGVWQGKGKLLAASSSDSGREETWIPQAVSFFLYLLEEKRNKTSCRRKDTDAERGCNQGQFFSHQVSNLELMKFSYETLIRLKMANYCLKYWA